MFAIQGETTKVSEDDILFLADCFEKYGNQQSLLNVSELHGFLTALVICPEPVESAEWMGVLWGDANKPPAWESPAEFERWYALLKKIQDIIFEQINLGPEYFNPLFAEACSDDSALADTDSISIYWRIGFARATSVRPGLWMQIPEPFYEQLKLICEPVSEEKLEPLNNTQIDEAFSQDGWEIILAVFSLYNYWTMITQMPEDDDSLCHCGSNLLYFKCCGLN